MSFLLTKSPSKQLLFTLCACKLNASFHLSVDDFVKFKKGNRLKIIGHIILGLHYPSRVAKNDDKTGCRF